MIPEERIIEDGDISITVTDVGPVTEEEANRADDLFKKITAR